MKEFSELLAGDCEFPIGDAPLPGERPGLAHLFCGEPVERGRFMGRGMPSPYCPACGALAYRAPTKAALADVAIVHHRSCGIRRGARDAGLDTVASGRR